MLMYINVCMYIVYVYNIYFNFNYCVIIDLKVDYAHISLSVEYR